MASSSLNVSELGLPAPDSIAAAHAVRVADAIRAQIEAQPLLRSSHKRSISFADFMRAALYAPGLGYYTAGATKLGSAGDFVTAPELTPLFGASIANVLANNLDAGVIELGAGSGALAKSLLAARPAMNYQILEVSSDLRQRQQTVLAASAVQWLDALPDRISGLVLMNEVLDALPCDIVRFHAGHYEEARIVVRDDAFAFEWRVLLDGPLWDAAKRRVPPIEGYTSEINLAAEALVASLCERLDAEQGGAICMIDYGFPQREYYLPDRSRGTLACHYRHRVHFDPLILLGLQDITAHVDFTAMAEAAVEAGAELACYTSQAKFLLHAGILSQLETKFFAGERERVSATSAVQKLLSPTEMGELFKVLVVSKGPVTQALEPLVEIDQSFRL
jgi:SAM-dependent MidA family methyltransferase